MFGFIYKYWFIIYFNTIFKTILPILKLKKLHTSGTSFIIEHGARQTIQVLSLTPGMENLSVLQFITL